RLAPELLPPPWPTGGLSRAADRAVVRAEAEALAPWQRAIAAARAAERRAPAPPEPHAPGAKPIACGDTAAPHACHSRAGGNPGAANPVSSPLGARRRGHDDGRNARPAPQALPVASATARAAPQDPMHQEPSRLRAA